MSERLRVGLLVNPLAGLGGSRGFKGSDGERVRELVRREGVEPRAETRTARALAPLVSADIDFFTWGGDMGASVLSRLALSATSLGEPENTLSDAGDTRRAAEALADAVDLLVFVGGDGTARDVLDAVGENFPVLGVPAGVKMHSAVFAVSPEAAGELLLQLARGGLVGLRRQEVRDIDEDAFREGQVRTRFYGEMAVPGEGRFLQHTKVSGREDQGLVAADIAAWLVEQAVPGTLYLVGPGSTTAAFIHELGLTPTLLGVDAVCDGQLLATDANEAVLLRLLGEHPGPARILVTAIGGQGHIFGRGNQQLSPAVIRAVGLDCITLVAAKSKILALGGRPLLADTNDPALDRALAGLWPVTTGYDDEILYRVGPPQ